MICPYCKEAGLVYIHQDEPYHEEYYLCIKCDSTYSKSEVKDDMI